MPQYELRDGEPLDRALRRFKQKIREEGIINEIKKREFYEKPCQQRRKKHEKAKMREIKRRQRDDR